jgi:hypothetical protein
MTLAANILVKRGLLDDILAAAKSKGYRCDTDRPNGTVFVHLSKPDIQYMLDADSDKTSITRMSVVDGSLVRDRHREYEGDEGMVEAAIDLIRALLRH